MSRRGLPGDGNQGSNTNILDEEKYCEADSDCVCGINIRTGECFKGNKNYVRELGAEGVSLCGADFCTGISGTLRLACVNNRCEY